MRIVSQKRDYSVDFENTAFWTQSNIIYAKIGNDSVMFGMYESKERAAEVFEDIHKSYTDMPVIFTNVDIPDELSVKLEEWKVNGILAKCDGESKIEIVNNSVYFMPEV